MARIMNWTMSTRGEHLAGKGFPEGSRGSTPFKAWMSVTMPWLQDFSGNPRLGRRERQAWPLGWACPICPIC